jgi:hypothetical protein
MHIGASQKPGPSVSFLLLLQEPFQNMVDDILN